MESYRKGAHTVYRLHYHFVFITKYRKPALRGVVGERVRELIREICRGMDIEIVRGHVRPDHVHLMLSLPPSVAPSVAMQRIKGKTSHHLLRDFRALGRVFWGRHVFARGYFVATTGNVTDDVVKKYVEEQDVAASDDDTFKVSE
jgi:putative transposase